MLELLASAATFMPLFAPPPQPIQRVGTCPLGWYNAGAYCIPSSHNSKPIIEKFDSCPLGYYSSGKYCSKTN
jgi:hypothetical protein